MAAWRAAIKDSSPQWPVHLTMADDLIESGMLRGKTRTEIVALLGPPTDTSYIATWDMVYYLGPERGMIRIDSEWPVLKVGPDGHVQEIALLRD